MLREDVMYALQGGFPQVSECLTKFQRRRLKYDLAFLNKASWNFPMFHFPDIETLANMGENIDRYSPIFVHAPFNQMAISGIVDGKKVVFYYDDRRKLLKESPLEWMLRDVLILLGEGENKQLLIDPACVAPNLGEFKQLYRQENSLMQFLDDRERWMMLGAWAMVGLIQLLHCKNVVAKDTSTEDLVMQPERRCARYRPIVRKTVKTIYIQVPQKQATGGVTTKDIPWERYKPQGTKLCRGHFKTYTQDRPLFGKYVGTWYWEPQVPQNHEPVEYRIKQQ